MSDLGSRIATLRAMRRNQLVRLRQNCESRDADENGSATSSVIGTLRFLAVADYILDGDVRALRYGLVEAASLRRRLFDRYDAGESISPSYVSMLAYKALFNALAAGSLDESRALAERMGGRASIEDEYDRPFDIAMGYALKSVVIGDDNAALEGIAALGRVCEDQENSDYIGYPGVLGAIVRGDPEMGESALDAVIAGHKRQMKGAGLFRDTEDELLCVWGVGLVNLARMRGLALRPREPLIPAAVLI